MNSKTLWQFALGVGIGIALLIAGFSLTSMSSESWRPFGGLILIAAGVAIYLLPYLVARNHHHRNAVPIFLLNFFLGWTLIGWVAALVWACKRDASGNYS